MTNSQAKKTIDMADHQGLRGIMSIWIVVFHALMYTAHPVDLEGSSLMPMFFLLSGFSLTIGYYSKLLGKSVGNNDREMNNKDLESNHSHHHMTTVVVASKNYESLATIEPNDESTMVLPPSESASAHHVTVAAPSTATTAKTTQKMSYFQFIINRLLRVLPAYYVCTCIVIPCVFAGYAGFDPHNKEYIKLSFITTFIPTSSWFGFLLGSALDGPSWTVQTLIGLWLMFPFLLNWLHQKSDAELLVWVRWFYWIQMLVLIVVTVVLLIFLGFWPGFCFGTMNPLSRIWCFAMGVAAGIVSLRHKANDTMPWFSDSLWFMPFRSWNCKCYQSLDDRAKELLPEHSSKDFEQVMFVQTYVILGLTLSTFVLDAIIRSLTGGASILGSIWLQALVPYSQLNILVAMTRHNSYTPVSTAGASTSASTNGGVVPVEPQPQNNIISAFLRHPVVQWLGDLSMSVYLIHYPMAYYLLWANHGKSTLHWPLELDCSKYDKNTMEYDTCQNEVDTFITDSAWPQWTFVVLPFLSIVVAFLIFQFIEKPFNKLKF